MHSPTASGRAFLERNPGWATVFGDERYDDRLDDPSAAGRARELEALDELERDAAALESPDLPTEDRVTLDILRVVAHMRREYHAHRLWQMDGIDQMSGPQTLPTELARFQRVDTPERLGRLIARLDAYPAYMAAVADNIQAGSAGRSDRGPPGRGADHHPDAPCGGHAHRGDSPLLAAHPELAGDDRAALDRGHRAQRPAGAPGVPGAAGGLPAVQPRGRGDLLAAGR